MQSAAAIVLALASVLSTAAGHGVIVSPPPRMPGAAYEAACGLTIYNNQKADPAGPVELLMQSAGSIVDAEACNMWLCKGYQFSDNDANVQTYARGETIPMRVDIRAPHTGYANVSIVDTASNSVVGAALRSWTSYASTATGVGAGETAFDITIPTDLDGCSSPGDCVIQWFWYSPPGVDQTYEGCIDFVVPGSAGTSKTLPATTTAPDYTTSAARTTSSIPTSVYTTTAIPTSVYPTTAIPTSMYTNTTTSTSMYTNTTMPTSVYTAAAIPTSLYTPAAIPTSLYTPAAIPTPPYKPAAIPTSMYTNTTIPTSVYKPTAIPTSVYKPTAIPTSVYKPTAIPTSVYKPTAIPTSVYKPAAIPTSLYKPAAIPTSMYTNTTIPTLLYTPTAIPTSLYTPAAIPTSMYPTTSVPTPVYMTTAIPTPSTLTTRTRMMATTKPLPCATKTPQSISRCLEGVNACIRGMRSYNGGAIDFSVCEAQRAACY